MFNAAHCGDKVTAKTVRLLKKICRGILAEPKEDAEHKAKARNLNKTKMVLRFQCNFPVILLLTYGFEERQNLYTYEQRLAYGFCLNDWLHFFFIFIF